MWYHRAAEPNEMRPLVRTVTLMKDGRYRRSPLYYGGRWVYITESSCACTIPDEIATPASSACQYI